MMECSHLRELVIRPTLQYLNLWSESAENLLLGTVAQESHFGHFLRQLNNGPALGIYQMEPATHTDICNNYLAYRRDMYFKTRQLRTSGLYPGADAREMIGNLYYATAMARIHYLRVSQKLPDAGDIRGLAQYWKDHYNTNLGKGTTDEFIVNYRRFVK